MKRSGFTIIEVVIVFLLILGVTFLILPMSLDNTKHAKMISKWSEKYSEIEYMFSVIRAQEEEKLSNKFSAVSSDEAKKQMVLDTISPFLRITSRMPLDYSQHYMSGMPVMMGDQYYFDVFYKTEANEAVGVKWVMPKCVQGSICAIMSLDINGEDKPNTWGYDVYGINLYKNKIEPVGKGIQQTILKNNCSKRGTGVYCSYYYLIGGKFD